MNSALVISKLARVIYNESLTQAVPVIYQQSHMCEHLTNKAIDYAQDYDNNGAWLAFIGNLDDKNLSLLARYVEAYKH